MNLTSEFLGSPAGWGAAGLSLSSVHGLWGGYVLAVTGAGAATVRLIDPGQRERAYATEIGAPAAHDLLRLCVTHDLLAIEPPERASLVPDEASSTFRLSRGRRAFALVSYANDPPHAGLAAIAAGLLALRGLADGRAPFYEGPYRG
jgi:hypothetical protein